MYLVDLDTYRDPDPQDQAKNVRHLSKYIFPLQYGLRNVFTSESQAKGRYKQPDFTDRESETKRFGPCKTPKRVKDVLALLDKMLWRHGKCRYKIVRDSVCPSKASNIFEC
ncbi:hypothetical protein BDR04DRAFT_1037580 [Suillus decipiens]|nr:hypothetical protein BDR04DRAFT_1037580 [Suillus decipiens]